MQVLKATTPVGFTSPWARSWDQSNATNGSPAVVKYINPSSGTFDWTVLDRFMSNNVGKKKIITLGVPADWMITRAATGGATFGGKSNMCPTGATELNTNYVPAITAIVDRAKTTWGETGIHWELWNEIEGTGNYNDSFASLGPYAKAVSQAIKAVDATAVVLTPSARDSDTAYLVQDFLETSDGAGGFGGDWVDGIAMHVYMAQDPTMTNGGYAYKVIVDTYRQGAIDAGYPSLPIYCTESGSLVPLSNLGTYLQRRIFVFAGMGVKSFIGYASDFPSVPLAKYADAWNEAVSIVSGKTISSVVKLSDGRIKATVNGVDYVV